MHHPKGSVRDERVPLSPGARIPEGRNHDATALAAHAHVRRLVDGARLLATFWRKEADAARRVHLAVAALLSAHAAADALLNAWALENRPELYQWKGGSLLSRAARFTAAVREPLPDDLRELYVVSRALRNVEGDPLRAPLTASWIEDDGVERALAVLDALERMFPARG